jgi:DNA-binding NarL/FixJ family response regulator
MTRILIADNHALVRAGLRRLLRSQPGWEVVAETANGEDAINKVAATTPDVAVLDCMMSAINGVEGTLVLYAIRNGLVESSSRLTANASRAVTNPRKRNI